MKARAIATQLVAALLAENDASLYTVIGRVINNRHVRTKRDVHHFLDEQLPDFDLEEYLASNANLPEVQKLKARYDSLPE